MPLQVPVLDNRNFEQLLDEAKRRIPSFTPEWTNFGVESDPGITLVELFAFLTESLLYRANRFPDLNRLKFLQLLGVSLQPAAPADSIITIRNERGPLAPLPLLQGLVISAGQVDFLSRDPVNVLPVMAQLYYKQPIPLTDPRYQEYTDRYEAIKIAQEVAAGEQTPEVQPGASGQGSLAVKLAFYETIPMSLPIAGNLTPVLDLATETLDKALYIALLAPPNVDPALVRPIIARQTLSLGVVPALGGGVPPLKPLRKSARPAPTTNLIFEIADAQSAPPVAAWLRLQPLLEPDVLNASGVVQLSLPDADRLKTWPFADPLEEGTGDFPPRIADEQVARRLVTWLRLRLPTDDPATPAASPTARLTWVGINATRVLQVVPVFTELLGTGTGEPDQIVVAANTPVVPASVNLTVQNIDGVDQPWRLVDDLLAARAADQVFTLDAESGQIRFGDGLRGTRPGAGQRILISYHYGGGIQGNVSIGAIKTTPALSLQGGYTIENPVPTSGGDLGESVAQAERNIPSLLRHRDRLVTERDFRDIALRTPGVDMGRVEVLPLFLPGPLPQDAAPGVVTLLVIPQFDLQNPLWPTPDRLFLQRVCEHLDPRRLVTTEIYVRKPDYVPVFISAGIQVRGGFFPDQVRQAVRDRLSGYLSSLPRGGPDGQGWPLNKRLVKKDLEAVITRVSGVEFVDSLELGVTSLVDVPEYDLTGLMLPIVSGLNVTEGAAGAARERLSAASRPPPPDAKVVPVPILKTKC